MESAGTDATLMGKPKGRNERQRLSRFRRNWLHRLAKATQTSRRYGLQNSPPHEAVSLSATDCEKVQRCPPRSRAEYCRSPNGYVVGSPSVRAPAATALAWCASTSATGTMTRQPDASGVALPSTTTMAPA